jgi:hypothetical protein
MSQEEHNPYREVHHGQPDADELLTEEAHGELVLRAPSPRLWSEGGRADGFPYEHERDDGGDAGSSGTP